MNEKRDKTKNRTERKRKKVRVRNAGTDAGRTSASDGGKQE